MADFIKTKGRRTTNGIHDPELPSEENIAKLEHSIIPKVEILRRSELFQSITKTFKDLDSKVTRIRCLALGSPSQETPALYQLALLQLIVEFFKVKSGCVSLYDPVSTKLDQRFFTDLGYVFEDSYEQDESTHTLFFLPHAPLELTDEVINSCKPTILLANNISTHTERLNSSELYNKYPILSKLVHLIDQYPKANTRSNDFKDGFETVMPKRKNRKSKFKYVEPTLEYSAIESYFSKVELVSYKEFEEGEWNNSFTDLAFHRIY